MSQSRPKLRLVPAVPESGPALRAAPSAGDRSEGPAPLPPETRELTLEVLYQDYAPYVGAVASRLLGRAAEVEDVVQDVFTAAVHGLRRREDALEIKGWLAKVTVRRCVRQLRLRRLWRLVDLDAEPSYERLADPSAGPAERRLVSEVYRALDGVSANERVAWALRYVEGESLEEVARLCDCSLATAKRRISAAHEKIKERTSEERS